MSTQRIRVIAICPFLHNDRILVMSGFDSGTETYFYRPLGGTVEFGESTVETLHREIREELNHEIKDVRLLGVLENIFEVDGQTGHEIVYTYDAKFVDNTVYDMPTLMAQEDDGTPFEAKWMALDEFNELHRLVPGRVLEFLK